MTTSASARSEYERRSKRTQKHVLDAALDVLIDQGYGGASTLSIQQRAGVSRGRLLNQYPHRDALLVAAVQHLAKVRVKAHAKTTGWSDDRATRIAEVVDAMWSTYQQGFFWAATELWLAARYNSALAEALAPQERDLGEQIRVVIDEMFGPDITVHPHYPAVREVLNSSMRGVALTYSFAPRDAATDTHLPMWRLLAQRELAD